MRREIKFRAYQEGEMLTMPMDGNYAIKRFFGLLYEDNYTVMQYTGLKDKNDVEIYEGDILAYGREHYNGNILTPGNFPLIVYYTDDASFEVRRNDNKSGIPDLRQDMTWNYEVIGNIYQNPELITLNANQ